MIIDYFFLMWFFKHQLRYLDFFIDTLVENDLEWKCHKLNAYRVYGIELWCIKINNRRIRTKFE